MYDIKDLIGYLYIVREKIRSEDKKGLWDYYCPQIRNTEHNIEEWEKRHNICLPESYRNFLLAANGWKCVCQDRDLFSLEELSLSNDNQYIETRDFCKDNLLNTGNKELLLPIGGSEYSYDIFLLVLDSNCDYFGQVLWVAGEEIERYQGFEEFFLSIIQHNKYNYKLLTGKEYPEK